MKARLNQLKLADDTALGLAFAWLYMVGDACANDSFGAYIVNHFVSGNASDLESKNAWRGYQLVALLLLAFTIANIRYWRLKTGLRTSDLGTVDLALESEARNLAERLRVKGARFLCTACLTDANAFCAPTLRNTVILGGGLRVLLRKRADHAKAILAHECAHLARRDTWLLVGTWYTFVAYTTLLFVNFVVLQAIFWHEFAILRTDGLTVRTLFFSDIFKVNFLRALRNGIPELVSATVLAIFLRHFVRVREYFADEVAAQQGFRITLKDCLRKILPKTQASALIIGFHPSATARLARLDSGEGWGRPDLIFCAAVGALLARTYLLLGLWIEATKPDAQLNFDPDNPFAALSLVPPGMWVAVLVTVALSFSIAFIACNHLYRTLLSRRISHGSFLDTVATALAVWASVFAGVFIGELTSSLTIRELYALFIAGETDFQQELDSHVFNIVYSSLLIMYLIGGVVMAMYMAEKRFHHSSIVRIVSLILAITLNFVVAQIPFNVVVMVVHTVGLFSWARNIHGWDLTTGTTPPGTPSPLESLLVIMVFNALVGLCIFFYIRTRRGRASTPALLHPDRILNEHEASSN